MNALVKPILLLASAIGVYSVAEVKHTPTEYNHDVVIYMDYNSRKELVVKSEFNEPKADTCMAALAVSKHFNQMLKDKKGCQIVLTTQNYYSQAN